MAKISEHELCRMNVFSNVRYYDMENRGQFMFIRQDFRNNSWKYKWQESLHRLPSFVNILSSFIIIEHYSLSNL